MLPDGINHLIEGQVLLPLMSIASIIARPRAVQSEEAGKTIWTQFANEQIGSMAFKLLIR
jgi:hypothetical protein